MINFKTHAKTILVGEHAVLRGSPALVLPLFQKQFILSYEFEQNSYLKAEYNNASEPHILHIFWHAFDKALQLAEKTLRDVPGSFLIENNIPIGAGMGFSAALCVTIAQWFAWMNWITSAAIFEFSKTLENLFHGKSSGVDIAGVMTDKIVRYHIDEPGVEITPLWQPKLYLSFSQKPSITSQCIKKVADLRNANVILADHLDNSMMQSVENAQRALMMPQETGITLLTHAIEQAHQCFNDWDLLSIEMRDHIAMLKKAGAIAAKPTGAGQGGYVLSLWESDPIISNFEHEIFPVLKLKNP